ncbi:sporulation initiation phosphotransferase B [Heyndrickxia acidicola]|uniref:Sporulation initiation phosphotransferase B n=1 Tax=Heyndrickxia acidicola TaxID=209389 RepID=A0ABU6MP08_9BACI|nr:sporulation initiation phosphotransferase B [Heyndrickxia acidicola]MED1204780.1 sporulation initiation phosphotransferase B [Heyndrickxia acidicola]
MKNWTVVEVLRHARHDWMNKLQLIKGNVALNKYDQVERILEEIIMEAHQESRISNLKLPAFAQLLLTFNWEHHQFQIEYEMLNEEGELAADDLKISQWLTSLFDILDHAVAPYHDNHLYISFDTFENSVRFFFEFSGTITNKETVAEWMEEQKNVINKMDVKKLTENSFTMEALV